MLLQKQQKSAAKFSLSPWYSELLALISARANNNTSCTRAFISPGEKKFNTQSRENADVPNITENLTTETVT